MKIADFIVDKRPNLAKIDDFPIIEFADYERRLANLQETLQRIQQAYLGTSHRAVIVLEGWDTAGKGGVVRRLGWALDPRSFKVNTIAAPGEREKSLHYLQRFWERLPQTWPDRGVRPLMVRPGDGRAGRGFCDHRMNGAGLTTRSTTSNACCAPTACGS